MTSVGQGVPDGIREARQQSIEGVVSLVSGIFQAQPDLRFLNHKDTKITKDKLLSKRSCSLCPLW